MPSPFFVLSTWVTLALQCLRLSIDLIHVASSTPAATDATVKSSRGNINQQTIAPPPPFPRATSKSTQSRTNTTPFTARNADNGGANYGSVENIPATTVDDQESLLLVSEPRQDSPSSVSVCCQSHARLITEIQIICTIILVGFAISSLQIFHVSSSPPPSSSRTPSDVGDNMNGHPEYMSWAAVWTALEAVLSHGDETRSRYGMLQRILRWVGTLFFALSAGSAGLQPWAIALVALILGTAGYDDWYSAILHKQTITNVQQAKDQEQSIKTRSMSVQAMAKILKPYFWPNATDATAFWNRVRAISTWLFLIASKACNLTAPVMVGHASTCLAHQDYEAAIRYSIHYAILLFLGVFFNECKSVVYLKVASVAFVEISSHTFDHLHHLSLDWHLRKKLGEVLRGVDRGILACDQVMQYLFLWLIPAIGECLAVTIIFACYFNYLPLALVVFSFVFVYIVWTILVTLWRKKFRKALVSSDNEWHDRFADSLVNFETVKHFAAESHEKERFRESIHKYQSGSVIVQASLSFLNITQQVLLQCCMATALSLTALGIQRRLFCCTETVGCESSLSECCRQVDKHTCPGLEVGDFVAVVAYVIGLFAPLNFLGSMYNAVVMAIIDLATLSGLLAASPDVIDAKNALPLPLHPPSSARDAKEDIAVQFDNVYFHYPTQSETRGLKGLSFKMKRGTTTAIVGKTGEGKTTVSRLLFRFYDVLGGAVKVNGVDVRTVTQKSLRDAIGVVPQAASMFNDTLKVNLRYGKQDASDAELRQAAQDAQLLDFIESLDDGWETLVGDRGLKLSGGEKQRAAIARCLLKNPPFVILDEATSALDTVTENSVQEALDRLGENRTVLVIAHRLGTIRNADNIVVLQGGQVAEQGTHDELLALNGVYAEMWNLQLYSTSARSSREDLLSD